MHLGRDVGMCVWWQLMECVMAVDGTPVVHTPCNIDVLPTSILILVTNSFYF